MENSILFAKVDFSFDYFFIFFTIFFNSKGIFKRSVICAFCGDFSLSYFFCKEKSLGKIVLKFSFLLCLKYSRKGFKGNPTGKRLLNDENLMKN